MFVLNDGGRELGMTRQCAWCLRLMNSFGEHLSQGPVPKEYDATHGMCLSCAVIWLRQAMETEGKPAPAFELAVSGVDASCFV